MSLRTTYSDENIVVEEPLSVSYTNTLISGSWGYGSLNVSGSYAWMREYHRYATKRFRYVGMTYEAAITCRDALRKQFTRQIMMHVWNGGSIDGNWDLISAGETCLADIRVEYDSADAYNVSVTFNEDDVRYSKPDESLSYDSLFDHERRRTYGSDAHSVEAETEPSS